MTINRLIYCLPFCVLLLVSACTAPHAKRSGNTDTVKFEQPLAVPGAKNVILFIGDGMGVSTVTAVRILDGQNKGMQGEENWLPFEHFPHVALSRTYSVNQQVAESAGTATAILSGRKTNAGLIGIGPGATRGTCNNSSEHHLPSILQLAEIAGKSTGIVTTTRLSHATPAAAYAHAPERDWENDADLPQEARNNGCRDIALQFVEFNYGDGIEVALGGGRIKFLPSETEDPEGADMIEGRQDGRNLAAEWQQKHPNSAYVWNREQFDAIDPKSIDHLLGLFNSDHMQFEADRTEDHGGEPSLAQMTRKAIEMLAKNPEGYFLLVEGGRIDHAHHDNNAYRALTDGIAFAEAVGVADKLTDDSDTLIIVTADHSHPFTIGGYTTRGNPILGKAVENNKRGEVNDFYALTDDGKPFTTLGYQIGPGGAWVGKPRPDISKIDTTRDRDFLQQAGLSAEDGTHAGEDVAVYARGPGAEKVRGVIEQNEIFTVMTTATGLSREAKPAGGTK